MTSHFEVWESKEAYENNGNWNGVGDKPKELLFSFVYDDFEFLEKFIEKHPKFWEMWEIFQVAAWAEREREKMKVGKDYTATTIISNFFQTILGN